MCYYRTSQDFNSVWELSSALEDTVGVGAVLFFKDILVEETYPFRHQDHPFRQV